MPDVETRERRPGQLGVSPLPMRFRPLPFDSPLTPYEAQAIALLEAHRARDGETLGFVHNKHPRFLDTAVKWLPRKLTAEDVAAVPFDLEDARLVVARGYDFDDWEALTEYVRAVSDRSSEAFLFESAVEAVVSGDESGLSRLLYTRPHLIRDRSTRRTHFDPPVHRATLLHYISANGVEGFRQSTPPNAVAIAKRLLYAGADANALAGMYGGDCTTLSLLVSSEHPARAGLQVELVDTLIDFGASPNPGGAGNWVSPLQTALLFGYRDAADALIRRGARIDQIVTAAGLGRVELTRSLLAGAEDKERHAALALAAQNGQAETVRLLLEAGEDPSRYNPAGFHSHATPLHHAALAGHLPVVRLLVEAGARLDIKDRYWDGTPADWAVFGGRDEVAEYLQRHVAETRG